MFGWVVEGNGGVSLSCSIHKVGCDTFVGEIMLQYVIVIIKLYY